MIEGTSRDDALVRTDDSDYLLGLDGNDTLKGKAGNDVIDGGSESDSVNGNDGADIFILRAGEGVDHINDFADGVDHLTLTGSMSFDDLTFLRINA